MKDAFLNSNQLIDTLKYISGTSEVEIHNISHNISSEDKKIKIIINCDYKNEIIDFLLKNIPWIYGFEVFFKDMKYEH